MADSTPIEPGREVAPDVGTTTAWYATPAEAADFARQSGFALLPTYMTWTGKGWSKRPRPGCMWKEESTADPEKVRELWEKYAPGDDPEMRSMVSIHCGKSGVFVFDEDSPDALRGDFKRVMDESESLTLVRRSVSRGTRHVYFRQPDGPERVFDSVFEGGEVKGDGYVALSSAPPLAGVIPMPAPDWVLKLCNVGKPTVVTRSGTVRSRLSTENLDAWISLHSREPVVSDPSAFMRRPIEGFWERVNTGKDHRRMAALWTVKIMFVEAMAGLYLLSDAVECMLDAYASARKTDGTWTRSREEDFKLMWVGMINAYDSDGLIGRGETNILDEIAVLEERFASGTGFGSVMTDEEYEEIMEAWTNGPSEGHVRDRAVDDSAVTAMMTAPDPHEETHVALSDSSETTMDADIAEGPRRDVGPLPDEVVAVVEECDFRQSPEDAARRDEMLEQTAEKMRKKEAIDHALRTETMVKHEPEPAEPAGPAVEPPVAYGGSGRGSRIELDEAAYFGPHGEFVKALVPYTEADPAAMLLTTMAYYGAWLAKSRWLERGGGRHTPTIQCVIIGQSSIARKGTSHAMVRKAWEPLMRAPSADAESDPGGSGATFPMGPKQLRQLTGVASGESLIDLMSVPGTRAVMLEEEFVQLLRRIGRQGSTLGTVMRSVFDQKTLETHSRGSGTVTADGDMYSLSFVGHATDDELLSTITAAEIYGGSANRMLWVRAHPQRPLPHEEPAPESIFQTYREHLGVTRSGGLPAPRQLHMSAAARVEWERIYVRESEISFGLYGAVKARGPVNILRLALNIATSVGDLEIGVESLLAADAIWQYCAKTAWLLFGVRSGDEQVDALTGHLIDIYEDINQEPWMTTGEVRSMLGPRYTTVIERAIVTGLVQRISLPAVDSFGRPKKGRPTVFLMLADSAVDRLGLKRRRDHPRDLLDLTAFDDA